MLAFHTTENDHDLRPAAVRPGAPGSDPPRRPAAMSFRNIGRTAMAGGLVLCMSHWAGAQSLLDVWDSSDPGNYQFVGQIQSIATAQTGQEHYAFGTLPSPHQASGNPSGVNLAGSHANVWLHEDTGTGDLTFGFIFSNGGPHVVGNTAAVNFRIVGSTTDPYVTQSDDPGEAVETSADTFVGNYSYNANNTDGIAVSGIGGGEWTVIIDSVDFGSLITSWYAASGISASFGDDLALNLGGEYRITPAGHLPSGAPVTTTECGIPFVDLYDTTDHSAPAQYAGTIRVIQTAESGRDHYDFFSLSGHPSSVNLSELRSNLWIQQDTRNGDLTFGFIFGQDEANQAGEKRARLNFRVIDSSTPVFVALSDDRGEAIESPRGSGAFVGNFKFGGNTDGIAVGGISGSDWTIAIEAVDFGLIDEWYAVGGATPDLADDMPLLIGHEYRLVPACTEPSFEPVCTDQIPPEVLIDQPVAGQISTGLFGIQATIEDNSKVATASSDPAGASIHGLNTATATATGVLSVFSEGENTIAIHAADACGNAGARSVVVYRDSIAPVIELSVSDGALVCDAELALTVTVSDQTETAVSLNGDEVGTLAVANGAVWSATEANFQTSVSLAEGSNSISVTATDAAGNSATFEIDVTLDSTAPMVTIDTNGVCFDTAEIPVTVTVDDTCPTTVTGVVPGNTDAMNPTLSGMVSLSEGNNTLSATATDQAGNQASTSVSVFLDTQAPEVNFASPAAGGFVRGTIDFDVSATDSITFEVDGIEILSPGTGITSVELSAGGSSFASFSSPPFEASLDTALFSDGALTLTAEATDGKGHTTTSSITVYVDNTPPVVTIDSPGSGVYLAGAFDVAASASDLGSGVKGMTSAAGTTTAPETVFGSAVVGTAYTTVEFAPPSEDGLLTIHASARDEVGNVGTAMITVITDNTNPVKTVLSPADGSVVSGVITIETAVDDVNLASIEILVDGVSVGTSSVSPFEVSYDTTQRLDGTMSITVVATDLAGNTSQDNCIINVTVDNIEIEIHPETLNLKSKGGDRSVTAKLEGVNLALLLPVEDHALVLCVPGGCTVPVTTGFAGDDVLEDEDGDGIPELTIKFDRMQLISSLRAAGASGTVTLTIMDGSFSIGSDTMRVKH